MWLLPPVVGEINNGNVIILYEPIDKTSPCKVLFQIQDQDQDHGVTQSFTPNPDDPSRLQIQLLPNQKYNLTWNSSYYHTIDTNLPSRFIFLSCDLP